MRQPIRHERSATIFFTSIAFLLMLFLSLLAFMWELMQGGTIPNDTSFWFMFAFLSGILTIFLPCTLPLAFVTIPLTKEKRMLRSLGMILLFALGVGMVLALYGGTLGALGAYWLGLFPPAALAHIVPWVYLLGGMFAYVLSLGELGMLPVTMPTYAGKSPEFINSKKGVGKMFYIGLFLGNVGVGCPFPAIPLLLMSAVLSGSVLYGVLLFLIHAVGRVLPLLVLLSLATLDIEPLSWLTKNKARFERTSGWFFVVFTALLVTIGSYSHEWVYSSALYTALADMWSAMFPGVAVGPLSHGAGVFGEAVPGASWAFLTLVLVPLWWSYFKERREVLGDPVHHVRKMEREIERLLRELHGHEVTLAIPEGKQRERVRELDRHIDTLLAKRRITLEGMRYGGAQLEGEPALIAKEEALDLRRNWYITLTVLLVIIVYSVLS
jgi:cytochrome c-type biogenesis protein